MRGKVKIVINNDKLELKSIYLKGTNYLKFIRLRHSTLKKTLWKEEKERKRWTAIPSKTNKAINKFCSCERN